MLDRLTSAGKQGGCRIVVCWDPLQCCVVTQPKLLLLPVCDDDNELYETENGNEVKYHA